MYLCCTLIPVKGKQTRSLWSMLVDVNYYKHVDLHSSGSREGRGGHAPTPSGPVK